MRETLVFLASASALLAQGHLVEGNAASAVKVIVFEDLQCSDCAVFRRMMDKDLLPAYGSRVSFEHRDFPLPKHSWARQAAIAARHFRAIRPDLEVAWRRQVLEDRREITTQAFEAYLRTFARAKGADPDKAAAALADSSLASAVGKDLEEGIARGISRTPTVFVNGEPFIETFTLLEITRALDAQLAAEGAK